MSPSKVIVILVNWNRARDTIECIESLWRSTYPKMEIVVVDNGSSDDSVEQLRKLGRQLNILESQENVGFTGGNNLGIRWALDHDADYVFLLNNDTVIDPPAIDLLVRAAEADSSIGIISPKIVFYESPNAIWFGGASFSSKILTGKMLGYKQNDFGQFDQVKDLPFASGCAMFIRKQVFGVAGLLRDGFFAVYEDLDFCLRVKLKGFSVRYCPKAVVWHKESVSSGGHDAPHYIYYQARNSILFCLLWKRNFVHLLISVGYMAMAFTKRAAILGTHGKWHSVFGIAYGVVDAIRRKEGRCQYAILYQEAKYRKRTAQTSKLSVEKEQLF